MKSFKKLMQILITLAFVFSLMGPVYRSPRLVENRAQPLLLQLAAEEPEQQVSVIVQKSSSATGLESKVRRLGGVVTKDLPLINGFAAKISAAGARQLGSQPGVRWVSLDAPMVSADTDGAVTFTTWASDMGSSPTDMQSPPCFQQAEAIIGSTGPDDVYGYGGNEVVCSFGGLSAEYTPGYAISQVEIVVRAYVERPLRRDVQITMSVAGQSTTINVPHSAFNSYKGAANAGFIYVDVTDAWDWQWSQFDSDLQITIDQRGLRNNKVVYYDAVGLRITSLSSPTEEVAQLPESISPENQDASQLSIDPTVESAPLPEAPAPENQGASQLFIDPAVQPQPVPLPVAPEPGSSDISQPFATGRNLKYPIFPSIGPVDTSHLLNVYNAAVRAPEVWNEAPLYLQGQGVSVAVVDSGISRTEELSTRVIKFVNFNKEYHDSSDRYGHGTFVASIVAADGVHSQGEYVGMAPRAFLVNVRVSNDNGMGHESDIVEALQWIRANKKAYKIRVINLSLNSSVLQDYNESPLCAAVEMLWLSGVVVVVSAGNNGTAELYPPANDPYVITVGATEDKGTADINDDSMASFSAYGVTNQGAVKPELVAPGKDIIAYLPYNNRLTIGERHPEKNVGGDYFRMSGTSMSAPVVTGAVALLLQDEPGLTPDQVKFRLMSTARTDWAGYDPARSGAGYLDIYAAVHGSSLEAANQNVIPHILLVKSAMIAYWASQNGEEIIDWNAVNWNAVNWNAVNWNAVNWNAVNWNAVNWNAVNWNAVNWNAVNWNTEIPETGN